MKITLVIAVLICTYFVMLTVVVNKEAENKSHVMQKTRVASINTQQSGI
jgi:hypothetical protein